jgi:hypothetical protein
MLADRKVSLIKETAWHGTTVGIGKKSFHYQCRLINMQYLVSNGVVSVLAEIELRKTSERGWPFKPQWTIDTILKYVASDSVRDVSRGVYDALISAGLSNGGIVLHDSLLETVLRAALDEAWLYKERARVALNPEPNIVSERAAA